jgi:TonB family protein
MTRLAGAVLAVALACAGCARTWVIRGGPAEFPGGPYYSAGSRYRLDVITAPIPEGDTPRPNARAEVRVRGAFGYRLLKQFELVNEWHADWAAVTSDGSLVVTIGGGETDVIVFYRGDGTVIRRFHLRDLLTEDDIRTFGYIRSTHYRWISWRAPAFVDEGTMQLMLHFSKPRGLPSGQSDELQQLRIDLRTFAPTEPKRHLWPHPYWESPTRFVEEDPAPATRMTAWTSPTGGCGRPADAAPLMQPAVLEQRARGRPEAVYPEIAQVAKISGVVVLEILLSSSGTVECARVLTSQPFLDAAATQAVQKWTFAPFDDISPAPFVRGRISFNFRFGGWR